jgi:hypothetical protein
MKSQDRLGLKSALNRAAADDVTSWLIWIAGTAAAGALIKTLIDRHNSCAKAIADLLKQENITMDALKALFENWHQYKCNRRGGRPSEILKIDARKTQKLIEKIAKLSNCTPEGAMLALKHILGNALSPGMEQDLKDAIDRYLNAQTAANAALIASALAAIYASAQCLTSQCVKFVLYTQYLKQKFPGVELAEDVLEGIAYLIAAIIAIKVLIATSPMTAGAAGLTALLATYQTALANELESTGLAKPGQAQDLMQEILVEAEQQECQGDIIEEGSPNENPASDSEGPPPSGNFVGEMENNNDIRGVD